MLSHPVILALLAITPAVAILAYYLHQVRSAPEPWTRVGLTCLLGAAALPLAGSLEGMLAGVVDRHNPWLWSFLVIAPVEELLKLLALRIGGGSPTRYERLSSGLVYGVAAGVGFACAENLSYVFTYGAGTAALRAVTAVPSHALHSALMGLACGLLHRPMDSGRRAFIVLLGLAAAILGHGLYDALLLGGGAFKGLAVVPLAVEALQVTLFLRRSLERDLQEDMDLLSSMPLLGSLPASAVRRVAAGATRQRAHVDSLVVRHGRPGDALFVIMRGRLRVDIDGQSVATLETGNFFGERSVLTGAPRGADVVAVEETLLLRISRVTLMQVVARTPALAERIVAHAAPRFAEGALPSAEAFLEEARLFERGILEGLPARLAAVPLLAGLAPTDLESLAGACQRVRRGASARIVSRGRRSPGLCLILSGSVAVRHEGGQAVLVEGDCFGELGLLTDWPANATVTARGPVELAVLRFVDLDGVLAENPRIGLRLLGMAAERSSSGVQVHGLAAAVAGFLEGLGRRTIGSNAAAQALVRSYDQLRGLPPDVAETLSQVARPAPGPDAVGDIWFAPGGDLDGLLGTYRGPSSGARAGSAGDGLLLSREALLDAIARSPSVVRFVARLMLGGRRSDEGEAQSSKAPSTV